MTTQKLVKILDDHGIQHDTEPNPINANFPVIRARFYAHSAEYDTLQANQDGGDILINGQPDSLREWLGY